MTAHASTQVKKRLPSQQEASQAPFSAANLLFFALLAAPIFLFYGLLFRTLTGLPFLDDYDGVLEFVLYAKAAKGWRVLDPIFTFRHTNYILAFQNIIYIIQYKLLGHMHLKFLTVCGDLLVLPLFWTLWMLWREYHFPRKYALLAFVPASWILFQLQYASTLNCVMAPLQNVAVLIFTLAAFYYGARQGNQAFTWSLVFVAFSISASGGGLFVGPVLCVQLVQRREWKRLAIMLLFSLVLGWIYVHAAEGPGGGGLLYKNLSLSYAAAFLGSVAAGTNPVPAIAFALVLVGLFLYATVDRLYQRNAGLYYTMLFFFLQSLAVSCLRSTRGLPSALGSRYRINSAILVVLIYFFLAEKFRETRLTRSWRIGGATVMTILLLGFTLASDRAGYRLLHLRRQLLQEGIVRWEHHDSEPTVFSAGTPEYMEKNNQTGMYAPLEPYLTEALRAGIYKLPPPGPNQ